MHQLGISFEIAPRLVRGLDYYTGTTFEFQSDALDAAQNAIGAGGRYDGLVEQMGGRPTAGIGFGIGIERVLIVCDAEGVFGPPEPAIDVFVVDTVGGLAGLTLVAELRAAGLSAERSYGSRSMKKQWSAADRLFVGYCPDLFIGGVCHGSDEQRVYRDLSRLVTEEIAEIERLDDFQGVIHLGMIGVDVDAEKVQVARHFAGGEGEHADGDGVVVVVLSNRGG